VQNHVFDPPHVRIRVGETVVWHFQDIGDSGKHNVVSIDAPAGSFASPVQLTGTFRHTFTAPGRYRYDCTLHTNMRGFIDVVP
jgi:plastocyanin